MDEFLATEVAYKNGYKAGIENFSEELIKHFNDLEYRANTPRKTIRVDELQAQMDWILHKVAVDTIKEFTEEFVEAVK